MRHRLALLMFSTLVASLIAGCGRNGGVSLTSETSDSNYVRGQELKRQGREADALASFLRVIDDRGSSGAPDSHLEAGLLCEQRLRDPIAAVYHYRMFLRLAPSSPQAPMVRDHIDAALRDFARTLPGQPQEGQAGELEALRQENAALRAQLGVSNPVGRSGMSIAPVPPPQPTAAISPAAPPPSSPTSATARKHTVGAGDTLSKIAQQYYGDRSKYRQIFEANRDVMSDENKLPKIGTVLKIP